MSEAKYKRVLLKLSGEALAGEKKTGVDVETVGKICDEIKADIILLGKAIDAVYSADPKIDANAIKYDAIKYMDVLEKDLKVMDSTATAMSRDNHLPLLVFGIADPKNIVRAVKGEKIGTIVS